MRVESVSSQKGVKQGVASAHRIPAEGTALRKLYDHLQSNKGKPLILAEFLKNNTHLRMLTDFYGLDIRNLRTPRTGHKGKGSMPTKYVLAGEWFGSRYVDYIAQRLHP